MFNTFSHLFFTSDFGLNALLCACREPRDFTFSLCFLNKSNILVQILNCLHRLSMYPLATNWMLEENTWKKAFQMNKRVLHPYASHSPF